MVLETDTHPAQLKDDVESPGGSAVYAVHQLEQCGFRAALMSAVQAATERSRVTGEKNIYLD